MNWFRRYLESQRKSLYSPEMAQWVVQQYQSGKKIWNLGAETGIPTSNIRYILKKNNIPLRQETGGEYEGKRKEIMKTLPDYVLQYIDQNHETVNPYAASMSLAAPIGQVVGYYHEKGYPYAKAYERYLPARIRKQLQPTVV
jgi:hypothetical protein